VAEINDEPKRSYQGRYADAKKKLAAREPVWQPDTKVVILPPRFLVWLGRDDPQLCLMVDAGATELARYAATGKAGNATIVIATEDEVSSHAQELASAGNKILRQLPEPYRTRLTAVLLPIS